MIDRKAALLANADGKWIRTDGMRGLRLNAKVHNDTRLRVQQQDDNGFEHIVEFWGSGVYPLEDFAWTRVCVVEGPTTGVLCLLESSPKEEFGALHCA